MAKIFQINDNLKQDILSNLPENYSNLEKAILIYKRLCEKLQYSLDYYLEERKYESYFMNADNLKFVDGTQNKDVICFTFNAILTQLLFDSGVVQGIDLSFYEPATNQFYNFHDQLVVCIDGVDYYLDATLGVLDNNDLVLSKYAGHKPDGWICAYNASDESKNNLRKALEKVYGENRSLDSKLEKYVTDKNLNDEFLKVPLEERVKMFLELAKTTDYSLFGFNNLLKYKHLCFSGDEFGHVKDYVVVDKNIDLVFAKDRDTQEFKAFLFYNPEGYTDDEGYENFDKLQVFEISLKEKRVGEISCKEAKNLFNNYQLVSNRNDKVSPKMVSNGKINIVYEFEDGKPFYDHHQNPVNVIKKIRKHVKTGQEEEMPLE